MTATEEKTLKTVMGFGGYVTTELLALGKPELKYQTHYAVISALKAERFLIPREEFRVGKMPIIYQVTRKACAHFGRPNSYLRNKRKETHIHRAMIRGYFLYSLLGSGFPESEILCYSDERIRFFTGLGIREQVLPAKFNSGTRLAQIEEHILFSNPHTGRRELTILYTDNPGKNAWRQLHSLMEGYILLSQQRNCPPLHILVICERESQAKMYREAAVSKMRQHQIKIEAQALGKSFFQP